MGYTGKRISETASSFGRTLEIVKRPRKWFRIPDEVNAEEYILKNNIKIPIGFEVLPKRWIVERTFAWIGRYRRLSKDYEYSCEVSEILLFTAMTRTMLKRINKNY